MTPCFGYITKGNYDLGYIATVRDFHGVVLHETATYRYRSEAAGAASEVVSDLYKAIPAKFRIVRQVVTGSPDGIGGTYYITEYVADVTGNWVEKDYGNGCRSYRMTQDCNAKAVAKLREVV